MKKLTASQLNQLKDALRQNRPHQALQTELLDHLAIDIEHRMNGGQSYETALYRVMQEASPQAIAQLKQTYRQMLDTVPLSIRPGRLSSRRTGKHRSRPEQFQQWTQVSVITFVTLMICMMWVSQAFSVSLKAFGNVWLVGLMSLTGALGAQLLFQRRHRRNRHRLG
ncbi:hypothetical protein [Spirosoma sp.]|uniref:hypothetical protein n=1 Tax=Spirosoma sp. TaxID=1899569 RepID=UPI003B3A302D